MISSIFSAKTQTETILGVRPAFVHLAADAGDANDGIGQIHYLGEIFQGHHLAEVIPALAPLLEMVDEFFQPSRTLKGFSEVLLELGSGFIAVLL
ncbi:MAG: hypothetical protein FJ134_13255 [Deltaproteobacteria bacterium]|nr:hypothetical protein [Deltaproteobacteria bacterium]